MADSNVTFPAARIQQAAAVIAMLRPIDDSDDSGYAAYSRDVVERALDTAHTLLAQARAQSTINLAAERLAQADAVVALLQPGLPDDEDTGYVGFSRDVVCNALWAVQDLLDQACQAMVDGEPVAA